MQYRLLRIKPDGRVGDVLMLDLTDDMAALARGRDYIQDTPVEVWCGSRQVVAAAAVATLTAERFA